MVKNNCSLSCMCVFVYVFLLKYIFLMIRIRIKQFNNKSIDDKKSNLLLYKSEKCGLHGVKFFCSVTKKFQGGGSDRIDRFASTNNTFRMKSL